MADDDWNASVMHDGDPGEARVVRALDTKGLKTINQLARERHYNKTLDDETLARLDDDKFHTVGYVVGEHVYADGKRVPAHMRVSFMLAIKGEEEPEQHLLDVPMRTFDEIPVLAKNQRDGSWEAITPGNRLMRTT